MSYLINQIVVLYLCTRTIWKVEKVRNGNTVFMVFWPSNLFDYIQYLGRAYVLQDVTLYVALKRKYENVRLVRKWKLILLPKNSKVFYSAVPFSRGNEMQGEYLYNYLKTFDLDFVPKPDEIRFWENKIFMHKKFEEHDIPHPKSVTIDHSSKNGNLSELTFPVLSKIPNGNHSRGIVSHADLTALKFYIEKFFTDNHYPALIIQEQMDIKFDIRVVTIKDEVVYYYWRDKVSSDSFISTSTSNGSALRIESLPKEIMDVCVESSKRLGLGMAAYDITYEQETNIVPFIFEVSPSFLLNPIPPHNFLKRPYLEYKKNYALFNKNRMSQFIELKTKYVNSL